MQNEPILGDIFRYSATGSSIKKPVFMRVCGHFEARRTIRHDPNDVAPKRNVVSSSLAGGAKNDRCKPFFDGLQRFLLSFLLGGYAAPPKRSLHFPLHTCSLASNCFPDGADASAEKPGLVATAARRKSLPNRVFLRPVILKDTGRC